ncbi:Probable hexosyltransferase MUCI70 [Linum perenne]
MNGGGGSLGIRSGSYGSLDKPLQQLQQQNGTNGSGGNGNLLPVQSSIRSKPVKMFKDKDRFFHWIFKFAGRKKVGMLLLCIISAAVFIWVLYVGKGEDAQETEEVQTISFNPNITNIVHTQNKVANLVLPPPPPSFFLGYSLPPGHPCNAFTLPPPPADKKRTGPRPCPVCYLPVEEAIALMPKLPSFSPVLKNLTYIYENPLTKYGEFGGSDFGGYPTVAQRTDSYDIRESMSVHCGFVRGTRAGRNTGYDIAEADLDAMDQCRGLVVSSAIFAAFDDIQQPSNISEFSKRTVCFFMFVDEETETYLQTSGQISDSKKVGVWRIVRIHNSPYTDGRRTGKIPKLLPHRLFPNARFSLWIDGKLELVVDPYQILERHLWRKNATFAISRHYKRFDVFAEAEANKAAGKYANASIDFQIDFYKKEGLTPYTPDKYPILSDVPEGCVIIREHVPISNLFACLWFNEVDRFTSRDQISFSTVRDKIRAKTNWTVNMFLDCERRNFVVQKYHREVLLRMAPPPPLPELPESLPQPETQPAESLGQPGMQQLPESLAQPGMQQLSENPAQSEMQQLPENMQEPETQVSGSLTQPGMQELPESQSLPQPTMQLPESVPQPRIPQRVFRRGGVRRVRRAGGARRHRRVIGRQT